MLNFFFIEKVTCFLVASTTLDNEVVPDDEKDSQQDSFAEAEIVAIDEPSILPDQS